MSGCSGPSDSTDRQARLQDVRTDRSVLDSVTETIASFKTGLGRRDQSKVTEYLDAVRDVERRVQKAEEQVDQELPLGRPAGPEFLAGTTSTPS